MNNEQSYIELFEQHRDLIESKSVAILNNHREQAIETFKQLGFPTQRMESFAHSPINEFYAPEFGINLHRLQVPIDPYKVFSCDVPNLSTDLYFVVNDSPIASNRKPILPDGVFIGSLREFATTHTAIAERYYNQLASQESTDGSVYFNTAFAQDGFVVYVPQGIKLERPIQLVNILSGEVDWMVNRRILLIAEAKSEVKLLICDHTINSSSFLSNQVCEIFAEQGAYVDLYELEESSATTTRIGSTYLSQLADSNVMIGAITLHNGITRNNFNIYLQEPRACIELAGMAICDKSQKVDNYSRIDHLADHCYSKEFIKYVVDEQSIGAFEGRIVVHPDAQQTEAFQTHRSICGSLESKVFTKPQLEIYADDVKCSHGATVGQIDEQALFYLRSRGIGEQQAKLLLKFAFTSDVIDFIRVEGLRERMRHLIEKRFRGELSQCSGCTNCSNK